MRAEGVIWRCCCPSLRFSWVAGPKRRLRGEQMGAQYCHHVRKLGMWVLEHVQPFRTMAHNTYTQSLRFIYTLRWPFFSTGHLAKTKLFRLSSYSLESTFWNVRIVQSLFSKCFCNWEVLKGQQQGWQVVTPSTEVSFQKWAQWFASYYPIFGKKWAFLPLPKQPSMYGIFTYIYHKN